MLECRTIPFSKVGSFALIANLALEQKMMAHFANRMQIESTAAPSQDDGLYVSADACKLISLHAVSEIFRRDADEVVRNKNRSTVHPVSLL